MIIIESEIFDSVTRPFCSVKRSIGEFSLAFDDAMRGLTQLRDKLNESFVSSKMTNEIPDMIVNITQDRSKNAFCVLHNKIYIIGINVGLVQYIWNIAAIHATCTSALGRGNESYQPGGSIWRSLLDDFFREKNLRYGVNPSDGTIESDGNFIISGVNHSLQRYLFKKCIQIVVLHEISHVVGGHFDFLDGDVRSFAENGVQECENKFGEGDTIIASLTEKCNRPVSLSYALEFDADAIAAEAFMRSKMWQDPLLDEVIGIIHEIYEKEIDDEKRLYYGTYYYGEAQSLIFLSLRSLKSEQRRASLTHPNEIARVCFLHIPLFQYASRGLLHHRWIDIILNRQHRLFEIWLEQRLPGQDLCRDYFRDDRFFVYLRYSARRYWQYVNNSEHPMNTLYRSDERFTNEFMRGLRWPDAESERDQSGQEHYEARFLSLLVEPNRTSKYLKIYG